MWNLFLSTPSARRATLAIGDGYVYLMISIHALREEGDDTAAASSRPLSDFYPRPPRGGRHGRCVQLLNQRIISIHALREEGDVDQAYCLTLLELFLSTPSARRATTSVPLCLSETCISIHALREEGDRGMRRGSPDLRNFYPRPPRGGRLAARRTSRFHADFYPRPPRGGRRRGDAQPLPQLLISIHALREEGDQGGINL